MALMPRSGIAAVLQTQAPGQFWRDLQAETEVLLGFAPLFSHCPVRFPCGQGEWCEQASRALGS